MIRAYKKASLKKARRAPLAFALSWESHYRIALPAFVK